MEGEAPIFCIAQGTWLLERNHVLAQCVSGILKLLFMQDRRTDQLFSALSVGIKHRTIRAPKEDGDCSLELPATLDFREATRKGIRMPATPDSILKTGRRSRTDQRVGVIISVAAWIIMVIRR